MIYRKLIEPLAVYTVLQNLWEKQICSLYGGDFSQILSQILRNKGCEITCIDR